MEVAGMGYDAKWRLDAYCPLINAFPSLGRLAWIFMCLVAVKKNAHLPLSNTSVTL